MTEDFRKLIDAASKKAKDKAEAAVGEQLDAITAQADALASHFKDLKLTSPAEYDSLVKLVKEAAARNESAEQIVAKVQSAGALGQKLVATASNIGTFGAGALVQALLRQA
jgi:uncharacterized protein YdeI (YjbR/CyaY-like superfamily)